MVVSVPMESSRILLYIRDGVSASRVGPGSNYRSRTKLKVKVLELFRLGGPTRIRTRDQPVMSRPLYR